MNQPSLGGYHGNSSGFKSHGLPLSGKLNGIGTRYFGIDLSKLGQMNERELAHYADRARQMNMLREYLPVLQKHFTDLIQGQIEYEQFVLGVLKQVEGGAKAVDKAALDMWLLGQGYDKHLKLMNQKAGQSAMTLEAQYQSQFNLNNMDFATTMQVIHLRHQNSEQQIAEKVPRTMHNLRVADNQRLEKQARMELITHGTHGKPGGSFWARARQFVLG